MIIRQRLLHDVPVTKLRGVRVRVIEKTRGTVKATYTAYDYYIVCGRRQAKISRAAALALGVTV